MKQLSYGDTATTVSIVFSFFGGETLGLTVQLVLLLHGIDLVVRCKRTNLLGG